MSAPRTKLIFAVAEDSYFYSHRRPQIAAAQDCGFDVAVATKAGAFRAQIEALGVRVLPFDFERGSHNPVRAVAQLCALAALYRRERPRIVHHIAMKPVLLGAAAAWMAGVPATVNAFAGLGYLFTETAPRTRALRAALHPLFRVLLRRPGSFLLLQNPDDRALLEGLGLAPAGRTAVIRGSGVDLAACPALPFPPADATFTCAYAGRMIGIKGLETLRAAFHILQDTAPHVRLRLYGRPDPANPGSWSADDLARWDADSDNVSYCGQTEHLADIWAGAHLAVQASWGGEGVPKALLEAAASGRPIVATAVPGCREVVEPGKNGLLVPPRDAAALAAAIARLAADPPLCRRMGAHSCTLVESDLSAEGVRARTAAFYRKAVFSRGREDTPLQEEEKGFL